MRSYVLSFALLLSSACEKQAPAVEKPQTAPLPPAAPADPHAANPHNSADPHAGATQAALGELTKAPSEPPKAGGLTWSAPESFLRRTPKSQMRVAEYGYKGSPSAELGVFYFGADQGGSVEANMTRWIGQFTQADGSETKAKRSERDVHGVKVSLVEASGMFGGGMAMPGAPMPTAVPDAMLLGAIAKGPEGSVFFKFTGPKADLEDARTAFDGLVDSLTPGK